MVLFIDTVNFFLHCAYQLDPYPYNKGLSMI